MQSERKHAPPANDSPKAAQLASASGLLANIFAWTPSMLYPITQSDDARSQAFWAQLQFTGSAEASVFDGASSSNIIRQWAELSQWFPSLTPAVGNLPAAAAVGVLDLSFSAYSPQVTSVSTAIQTHTYLYESRFSSVWGAYASLQQTLK